MNKVFPRMLAIVFILSHTPAFAQGSGSLPRTTLSVFGGYTFQDRVEFSDAYGYIRDAAHYGAALEIFTHRAQSFELLYQRMDTKAPLYTVDGLPLTDENQGAALNYIMLGSVRYLPLQRAVAVYGGADIGVCVLTNKDDYTATKFAFDIKAGVRVKSSGRVGFKAQAQLFSVVQAVGGGMYAGTGGVGYGISTYSSLWQFGFTGAVTFDLL
jgi:hypothetical protein